VSGDAIEMRIRYWANFPRRTGKVMLLGKHIGDVWDNGAITLFDYEDTSAAPPVRARLVDEP
jgi:hypothetical protein